MEDEEERKLRASCRQKGIKEVRILIAAGRHNDGKVAIMAAELENMVEEEREKHLASMQNIAKLAAIAAAAGGIAAMVSAVFAALSFLASN